MSFLIEELDVEPGPGLHVAHPDNHFVLTPGQIEPENETGDEK